MELIRAFSDLFERHAPETLMALFGVGSSLLLFFLVWTVLQQLFGVQNRSADQEAVNEQSTAVLVESLVAALVTEASHLRRTMDGILHELLRAGAEHTTTLSDLIDKTEQTPDTVAELLKPEFEELHQAIRQAEARMVATLQTTDEVAAGVVPDKDKT